MFSNWRRWWFSDDRHVPDEDLLLLLDNEVAGWRARRILYHLDACWNCRVRKEKLQQAIHDYVAVRSQAAAAGGEDSARLQTDFERHLAAQEQQAVAETQRLRFSMPAAAWACLAIAAIALGVTQDASARATMGRVISAVTAWASKPEPAPLRRTFTPVATAPAVVVTKQQEVPVAAILVESAPISSVIPERPIASREIENAKVEILYSLHRTGSCLRYPLQVTATKDGLHVRGMLENADQKRRLTAIGRGREWIQFEIRAESEELAAQRGRSVPASAETEVVRGAAPAVQPLLLRYFRARYSLEDAGPMIVRFSNESLDLAATLKEHAWALRRLAENFPADASYNSIDQAHAWLLAEMVADHMSELRGSNAVLQRKLSEVFPAVATQAGADPQDGAQPRNWQAAVALAFASAAAMERATRLCFAAVGGGHSDVESAVAELVRSFAPAAVRISELQALVERVFDAHSAFERKPAPMLGASDSPKR